MYIPTVWLAALGACLASAGNGSDPSTLVVSTFGVDGDPGAVAAHPWAHRHESSTYTPAHWPPCPIGVRAARWEVTLIAGLVASGGAGGFVEADSFAHAFDNWMVSILVWISPWAAIMLVDYWVICRGAWTFRRCTRRPDLQLSELDRTA